jgi:cytoskeletal protein CcmA (bactofilin family)
MHLFRATPKQPPATGRLGKAIERLLKEQRIDFAKDMPAFLVPSGTSINGLSTPLGVLIDGTVSGKIESGDGAVIINVSGQVSADICCKRLVVMGQIAGLPKRIARIECESLLLVEGASVSRADIRYNTLEASVHDALKEGSTLTKGAA